MGRFLGILVLVAAGFGTQISRAETFEQDEYYIYQIENAKDHLGHKENIKRISEVALKVLKNYIAEMDKHGLLPDNWRTFEDLDGSTVTYDQIQKSLDTANKWVKSARQKAPSFIGAVDFIPDALLVQIGAKVAKNLGLGGGGSVFIGLVVLPVHVRKFAKERMELVEEYTTVRVAPIGWLGPDVGVGVDVGVPARIRWGASLIWSLNNAFNDPSQFVGVGLGASLSIFKFFGFNLKAGLLNNLDMPGWVDFVYLSLLHEMGAAAGGELHLNGTVVLPLQKMVEMFSPDAKVVMEESQRNLAKQFDMMYRDPIHKELSRPDDEQPKDATPPPAKPAK